MIPLKRIGIGGLVTGAFVLPFKSGERGLFPFDFSPYFDGAYRIASGQIPFRDFFIPYNLTGLVIQAGFFEVLGVDYFAFLLGGATLNVLAVLVVMWLVRLLFPGRWLLSYAGGLVTASWFISPTGIIWHGQMAFFFSLLAMSLIVYGIVAGQGKSRLSLGVSGLSGICFFLAFMAKQSAAVLFLPLYALLLVFAGRRRLRRLVAYGTSFLAGVVSSAALLIVWLWLFSDLKAFVHYFLVLPANFGLEDRIGKSSGTLLQILSLANDGVLSAYFAVPQLVLAVISVVALFQYWKRWGEADNRVPLAAVLCLYLLYAQNLFILSLGDQAENGCALLGVIAAAGLGLVFELSKDGSPGLRGAVTVIAILTVAAAAITGGLVSWSRQSHDIFDDSTFSKTYLDADKLSHLRWAEPTVIWGRYNVTEKDFRQLYRRLAESGENFFVFTDFTIFYGLLGVPSPQPLVAFYKGLTYPYEYDVELDRRIVHELRKHEIELVVIEKRAWLRKPYQMLADFPLLRNYLTFEFEKSGNIGMFDIFEKRSSAVVGANPE
jgi:hypothetical protein